MSKKILFICNVSETVINFRSELIKFLIKNDYLIDVLCADDERTDIIKKMGVSNVYVIPFSGRGTNPLSLAKLKASFSSIIRLSNPDIVFTFGSKANIIGASAAYKCKISKIVSMVEGAGDPFNPVGLKGRVLRVIVGFLYKKSVKHNKLVIFLNKDDEKEFIDRKIVKHNQTLVIPGIGIDTKNILKKPSYSGEKKVVMLSRFIVNKGIEDYCKIASSVRKKRKDIAFELYGKEQDLTVKDLEKYISAGDVKYCGFTDNPIEVISKATLYVSSSFYREGFPRTMLEAMAVGTPIIATDTIGSRDAVKNNVNGYSLHIHDIDAFTSKILEIIDDEKELEHMGNLARKYCEEYFDSDKINAIILNHLNAL